MEWIVIILIVLFFIGRLQRGSASHPANAYSGIAPSSAVAASVGASSGDTFSGSTSTIATGITQPPKLPFVVGDSPVPVSTLPPHVIFPIAAPPPIAIQRTSPVTVRPVSGTASPVRSLAVPAATIRPVYGAPRYRGY